MDKRIRWILYAAIVALYVLHNDWWFWNDPRMALGLPVGLTYHIGYNVAAALLMLLLVRFAWPSHLEVIEESPSLASQRTNEGVTTSEGPAEGEEAGDLIGGGGQ